MLVVRHHHQRRPEASVQLEHQLDHGVAGLRVEASGRLVGKQQLRPDHERAGERYALLFTAGKMARVVAEALAKLHARENLARFVLRVLPPCKLERQHDILQRRQRRQQLERLEHESDRTAAQLRALILVECEEIRAVDVNAARGGRVQPCEDREQRRLAGTGGADDRDGFAFQDGEFDFTQNDEVAVTTFHRLADAARLENCLGTHFRCIAQGVALAILLAWAQATLAAQTLVVFGDSLSASYGIAAKRGWVSLLGERLKKEKLDYRVVNASISGETTAGGRARLGKILADHKPDVVLLELGANDGLRGLPIAEMKKNLAAMVEQSQKNGARVLLVGTRMPPNYGPEYAQAYESAFADVAKASKIALAPDLMAGFAERLELFLPDRIHPNETAQPIVLDNVWKGLRPQLK